MSEIDRHIDAAWRAASREQPPAALDASIRAAARRAVASGPGKAKSASWWRVKTHWAPLAAAAAVAVIAVGILQLTPPEQVTPGFLADRSVSAPIAQTDARKPSAPPPSTNAEPARRDAAMAAEALARERAAERARKPLEQASASMQSPSNAMLEKKQSTKPKKDEAASPAKLGRAEPFPAAATAPAGAPSPAAPRSEAFQATEPQDKVSANVPAPAAPVREAPPPQVAGALAARTDQPLPSQAKGLAAGVTSDQARARDAGAPRPADEWIRLIRRLRAEGKTEEAAKELAAFRAAYKERADELLPVDLRETKP